MDINTIIDVTNRSNGVVIYLVPELNVRREFAPHEVKRIPLGELIQLSYRPGGMGILLNSLVIHSNEAMRELNIAVEPEYFLDEKGVVDILTNGSMDAFLDCLDFAPVGVLELIKQYAYELPVNDSRKRKAIKEKLGFDVDLALLHKQQVEEMEAEDAGTTDSGMKELTPQRRVQPATQTAPEGRRTTPKYKILQ